MQEQPVWSFHVALNLDLPNSCAERLPYIRYLQYGHVLLHINIEASPLRHVTCHVDMPKACAKLFKDQSIIRQ